jgi:Nif-specific regulatory protein
MDMAIEISGAERGWVILFEGDSTEIKFQTARNLQKKDIEHPEFEISHTIINKVKNDTKPVCMQNALDDNALIKSKSIEKLKVLSVICIPLLQDKRVFGVVYLDNRKISGIFNPDMFNFIHEFANFISTATFKVLERKDLQNQISDLEKELRGKYHFDGIVGQHPKIVEVLKMVSQVADTPAPVLIQGESGTGKELIARALHHNSCRRDKPFIAVNCAALPELLLESELFGHVKGAFTGAVKDHPGWFERADNSTIFLDEINDMSDALQARLLRILQTGDYSRVGSTEIQHCDVRVVAATSKNILSLVQEKKFREELYYRLNVIELHLPSLHERKSDIPLLIGYFMETYKKKYQKPDVKLSPKAEKLLFDYDYPGNIRELENIIQRCVILSQDNIIHPEHLPSLLHHIESLNETKELLSLSEIKRRESERSEKEAIIQYLTASQGHISKAAGIAGLDVSNFHKLIKKHDIDVKAFKN